MSPFFVRVAVLVTLHLQKLPALPKVDFDTSMVVIFAPGAQMRGGSSVQITRAVVSAANLTLTAEACRPSPGCIMTARITAPADLVVLPLSNKPVVVEEISVGVDC